MKVKNGMVDVSDGYVSEIHSSLCPKFLKSKQRKGTDHEVDFIFSKPYNFLCIVPIPKGIYHTPCCR